MNKFYGEVGYGDTVELDPGVYDNVIVLAKRYYGDVVRNTRRLDTGDKVNDDITVGNSISIVADAYARQHFFKIKYVEWMGTLWDVTEVEEQSPRLILRLGGVYTGPTKPEAPAT